MARVNAFSPPAEIYELSKLTGLKSVSPGQKVLLQGTLWCLIEDARLVFGTTWIFLGVLVLQSSFSVKRLPCLVFHPGFQLFLFAIQHDVVTVTSKVECHVY